MIFSDCCGYVTENEKGQLVCQNCKDKCGEYRTEKELLKTINETLIEILKAINSK